MNLSELSRSIIPLFCQLSETESFGFLQHNSLINFGVISEYVSTLINVVESPRKKALQMLFSGDGSTHCACFHIDLILRKLKKKMF